MTEAEIAAVVDRLYARLRDQPVPRTPAHPQRWWIRSYATLVGLTGAFAVVMITLLAAVEPSLARNNEATFTTFAALTTLGFAAMAPTTEWGKTIVMFDAGVGYLMFGGITGFVVGWILDRTT